MNNLRKALVGVFSLLAAAAFGTASACPPAPPPDPDGPYYGLGGAVYVTRDATSCRILLQQFGMNPATGLYEFWWAEGRMSDIESMADEGQRVVFDDRVMTPRTVRIVEFRHRGLDHYFMTAEGLESLLIEAGLAGSGWKRTGLAFTAWQIDPGVSQTIAVDLCRFYGSPTIGPNSHFYAAAGSECDLLKAREAATPAGVPRWHYEGVAFRVERALGRDGSCLPSTMPVLRLYNNGHARGIDPNHRYTTRREVADGMLREGWVLEGQAFCAMP